MPVACRAPGNATPASGKSSIPCAGGLFQALLMFFPKSRVQGTAESCPYNPINLVSSPHLPLQQPNRDLFSVPPNVLFSILSLPFSLVG